MIELKLTIFQAFLALFMTIIGDLFVAFIIG